MRQAERLRPLARPTVLLPLLTVVQWVVVAGIALSAQHNGWFWYQGGDQTVYHTTSWLLGQGLLPPTPIGYGWSMLTTPASIVGGANVVDALPMIVLGQYLFLLPVGLLAVWAIGESCGGRQLALTTAVLWATLPALSIPLFAERYHPIYVDTVLPQLLGLTNLGDFPSTIAVLVSAAFLLKGIDGRSHTLVLLAALAAGFAIGIKPANLVYLAAPFIFLTVARRPIQLLVFGAGLLPALVTLALWKDRGLGQLPVLAQPEDLMAAGGVLIVGVGGISLDRYLDVDWGGLWLNARQLQEVFWGLRVLEWFLVAGAFAIGRRSIPKATFLLAWLGSYFVFKGGSDVVSVQDGTFFRFVQPGLPAAVVLAAAVVLLVPSLARRATEPVSWSRRRTAAAIGAMALVTIAPLGLAAALPAVHGPVVAYNLRENVLVPVNAFPLESTLEGRQVRLQWEAQTSGRTRVFYRVLRSDPNEGVAGALVTVRDGLDCPSRVDIPTLCTIQSDVVATTRTTTYFDRPPPGRWTYRVAVSANAYDSLNKGDVVLVSKGAVVNVR